MLFCFKFYINLYITLLSIKPVKRTRHFCVHETNKNDYSGKYDLWTNKSLWTLCSKVMSNLLYYSFIHQWFYSPLLCPGLVFSFVIFFTQSVGLLGRGISPSQGRHLHTRTTTQRINEHTDIHALNGIRTHDQTVRESEDSSCLRSVAALIGLLHYYVSLYS
jgi:hypothetical protein